MFFSWLAFVFEVYYSSWVRIFKSIGFSRFAKKEGIGDTVLCRIADELEQGKWDASYGGDVYKKRVARPGEGKSGGYRFIVVFRSGKLTLYIHGFSKSAKDDISEKEERELKELARDILSLTDGQMQTHIDSGKVIEILQEA
jgi:hypothetical protein